MIKSFLNLGGMGGVKYFDKYTSVENGYTKIQCTTEMGELSLRKYEIGRKMLYCVLA